MKTDSSFFSFFGDLAKVFACVNNEILLELIYYSIFGTTSHCFRYYFNRGKT